MGKHDNRVSMKMRRRKSQKKLKARIKNQKAAKKPRQAPAPAKE